MPQEHPFAKYVRIIGKGPNLSRPLNNGEMYQAAGMIMKGQVEPLQLGAFLCILRMRTEDPEEGQGFVRAVRDSLDKTGSQPHPDLDWPTYSGKKRQLPWYLLAALLLADNGIRIFMQGADGHTAGRLYSRATLESLGVAIAGSPAEAAAHMAAGNFAFMPLAALSPRLQQIIDLKSVLGVRTPVNTFGRMINPFAAPYELQTVFHPNYRDVHRDTADLLGQPNLAVFKGEGGEAERRPQKPVVVQSLHDGERSEEEWPAMLSEESIRVDREMDPGRLKAAWRGSEEDAYGAAAVTGTMAIVLRLMRRAASPGEALEQARDMWHARNREKFKG